MNMNYKNEEVSRVAFKKDTCNNLSESCVECQLIKKDETQEMNEIRQLQLDMQKAKAKGFRKLVGGTR